MPFIQRSLLLPSYHSVNLCVTELDSVGLREYNTTNPQYQRKWPNSVKGDLAWLWRNAPVFYA